MEEYQQLYFFNKIAKKKPETINNTTNSCPFCKRENLTDILEENGEIIWLKNKYPTLQDTFQTVIIETDNCQDNINTYDLSFMKKLIRFSIDKWIELEQKKLFKSVILYKNHGPLSGGSIKHAHMQIVGMKNIDYKQNISPENFEGIIVENEKGVELNISTRPIIGFSEFNIVIDNYDYVDILAKYIQAVVRFILNDLYRGCKSYNIFFYHFNQKIICKVVPRFVVSPLFVGYKIPQVFLNERLHEIREHLIDSIKHSYNG